MKDLGWLPPTTKRNRYRLVRRSTLLTLALIATLTTSAVVIQQWVWSGQCRHKTLDFDKALMVLNDPKENDDSRSAALGWLQDKILHAVTIMGSAQETSLTPPAHAPETGGGSSAARSPWRRKWNMQLPLKNLPLDEALEIIYDSSLKLPIKPTAAARVYREVRVLLTEFKAIFKKSNGDLTQHRARIQHMMTVIPAGFSALVYWGQQNKTASAMSAVWIKDLLNRLSV